MGTLKLLLLFGLALLSTKLSKAQQQEPPTVSRTGKRVNCREAFNAARTKVNFPAFKEPGEKAKLPILDSTNDSSSTSPEPGPSAAARAQTSGGSPDPDAKAKEVDFVNAVCDAIETETETEACDAAVAYWKEAVKNFPSLPPSYSKGKELYAKDQNVSFVGLFNPNPQPTVDCAVITCSLNTDSNNAKTLNGNDLSGTVPGSEGENKKKTVYSLVCLSTPQALEETKEPFT
ncbi:hypothetical protein Emed_000892 [Eimeria media]